MAWHKSSPLQENQNWLINDAYCADTKSPTSAPSLIPQMPCQLSDFYKVSPAVSSPDSLKHIQNQITGSTMSTIESTSHWPALHSLAQYGPQTYHESPSPAEQYPTSLGAMSVDYGVSTADAGSYVYDLPPNFASIDAASTCPRVYSNEFDLTCLAAPESEAAAYPPTSYLMDPQKHELYMDPARQQTFDSCSFVGRHQETASLSVGHDGDRQSHISLPREQTSSSKPSKKPDSPKKNTTKSRKDEPQSGRSKKMVEETDFEEKEEPYAKLIYQALRSAPGYRMVLKDIYQWFVDHTDKGKNPSEKGWQNSIRHNLSMNGAFKKVEQDPSSDNAKKGFVWVLEPSAIAEGVKSTTRYRKTGPNKKVVKSDSRALQRQASGRKGGQAARRAKGGKSKRVEAVTAAVAALAEEADDPSSQYYGHEAIPESDDLASEFSARQARPPMTPAHLSEDGSCYPYYLPLTASLSEPSELVQSPYTINDIVGVADSFPGESLFCDSPGTAVDPIMAALSLQDASPGF